MKRDSYALRVQTLVARESPRQAGRNRDVDVTDPTASITVEVMMGIRIGVVTGGADGAGNLFDLSLGAQHVEIAIHGRQRQAGQFGSERRVDLARARMRVAVAQPRQQALALDGTMAARRHDRCGGGVTHGARVGWARVDQQAKTRRIPVFGPAFRSRAELKRGVRTTESREMRPLHRAPTAWVVAMALWAGAAASAGEVCEPAPTGAVSVIVLQSASAVQELGSALRGTVILRDATTVIFRDGRVISSDVAKVGDHLTALGWESRPIEMVASMPARRARPRGRSG